MVLQLVIVVEDQILNKFPIHLVTLYNRLSKYYELVTRKK